MAMALMALAALWLTPVLNAERIAASSQMARLAAGTIAWTDVVPYKFRQWGLAGEPLMAMLTEKAKEPGQEALATLMRDDVEAVPRAETTPQDMRAALVQVLPLQPPGATAARDKLLAVLDPYDIGALLDACRLQMPNGKVGCAMVFADLYPADEGDEAVVAYFYGDNYGTFEVMWIEDGVVQRRPVVTAPGMPSFQDDAGAMIAAMQVTVPIIRPVPMNMMEVAGFGMVPMP
jgi:hypothetical protein